MRAVLAAALFVASDASRNMYAVVPASQVSYPVPQMVYGGLPLASMPVSALPPRGRRVIPQMTSSDVAMLAVAGAIVGAAGTLAVEGRRASSVKMQESEDEENVAGRRVIP